MKTYAVVKPEYYNTAFRTAAGDPVSAVRFVRTGPTVFAASPEEAITLAKQFHIVNPILEEIDQ